MGLFLREYLSKAQLVSTIMPLCCIQTAQNTLGRYRIITRNDFKREGKGILIDE